MKNRTNHGMHYDASTAQSPVLCAIPFHTDRKRELWVRLLIPRTICDALTVADYDYLRSQLLGWHREHLARAMLIMPIGKTVDLDALERRLCETVLQRRAADFLYNEFIVKQAKAGNEAWEVPPTMQEISPSPELDEQHNDGTGRLM